MGRRFDLLVFDWDGTLVDSTAHIVHSIRSACADLDLPVPAPERASHVIGLGLRDALAYVLPDIAESRYAEVAERYRFHFLAGDHDIAPFAQVTEGLALLAEAGFVLAVATGKSRRGLDRSLDALNLGARFAATRCADEGLPKPHPEMLLRLMKQLDMPADRTLMIGDTTHDLQMAINAGTAAVAVGYGAHPRDALERLAPLGCVDSFGELMRWLGENA
jgi:phosphoglycolate phosphatase